MTLKLGNFTYHILPNHTRYSLSVNIISSEGERAKELGHARNLKESVKKQVLERDNYTCQICRQYGDWVDHIVPWRISRDNSPSNLRAICPKCNIETRLKRRDARLSLKEYYKYLKAELAKYKERQLALALV